jgi:NADP-dependent 3-hydroxy acid dehydrogenase YdfG
MKDLKGKVAFITGGSSGIGLGIAKVLADEGMKVVVTYRRQDHLEETLAYFRARPGQQVHAIKLDVTDRKGFIAAADEAERVFGPVQVLVNNAGIGILGLVEHATFDDWDWIMGVNIGGVVNAM